MPLFTLPVRKASSAPQSRAHFSSLPVRKRKRASSPTPSLASDDDSRSQLSRSEAAASKNPLSLTPAEVAQYRLAGLELDEEIPAVNGWPHRGFAAETARTSNQEVKKDTRGKWREETTGGEREGDESGDEGIGVHKEEHQPRKEDSRHRPQLRLQHLSILTTILQRCLLERDIPRASRAWAMLIRMQVGGQGMDLRSSGYWAIGAELLMRSGETRSRHGPVGKSGEGASLEGANDESQRAEGKRWGSQNGLQKTKEYYERLILQHPYKRQFSGHVSALDFWPAMVECEIYGIQYERKASLQKVEAVEMDEDDEASSSDSDPDASGEDDDPYDVNERKIARRRGKQAETAWRERDEIRKTSQVAYEKLAARLDELMATPPYSDSHVLLRLRAMLALCIGELSVPAVLSGEELGDENEESLQRKRRLNIGGRDTKCRLLTRQRMADQELGKVKQREERIRARKLFERIERDGGKTEAVVKSLPRDEDAADVFDDAEP